MVAVALVKLVIVPLVKLAVPPVTVVPETVFAAIVPETVTPLVVATYKPDTVTVSSAPPLSKTILSTCIVPYSMCLQLFFILT